MLVPKNKYPYPKKKPMSRIGLMTAIWFIGNAGLFVMVTTADPAHPMSNHERAEMFVTIALVVAPVTFVIALVITALIAWIQSVDKDKDRG